MNSLSRFITAQDQCFEIVISELNNNKKITHWMWFIFPQCEGLGKTEISKKFSIKSKYEAIDQLKHKILYDRLIICCDILLRSNRNNIIEILSFPDNLKLKSCLTLFMNLSKEDIFEKLLIKYFNGEQCLKTRIFLNI